MKEKDLSITSLQKKISNITFPLEDIKIYIFGSATGDFIAANDLDLIIEYKAGIYDLHSIICLKSAIEKVVYETTKKSVDFCTLSDDEVHSSNFVINVNAIRIL